jgi:hypothetical protein
MRVTNFLLTSVLAVSALAQVEDNAGRVGIDDRVPVPPVAPVPSVTNCTLIDDKGNQVVSKTQPSSNSAREFKSIGSLSMIALTALLI